MSTVAASELRELQDRINRAAETIDSLREVYEVGSLDRARLNGKREGLLLAESYLFELLLHLGGTR